MDFTIEPGFAPHPRTFRGVCEACGCDSETDEHRPVVHISSVSIDHEDGLYTGLWICAGCLRQIARALGMLDVRQVAELRLEIAVRDSIMAEDKAELARLRPVKEALAAIAAEAPKTPTLDADGKAPCPVCGDPVKPQGLGAHTRLKHTPVLA